MDNIMIEDEWISTLSRNQEKVLSVLFVISGLMSIFGSSTIIHRVTTNTTKQNKSYDRIMLGLSIADVISSISYILSPFLLPGETSQRVWAWGSHLTCQGLGFLTQLSFGAGFFNMFIYSRPTYYKLRSVGIPVTTALRGACFESDIPRMIAESMQPRTTKHEGEFSKDDQNLSPPNRKKKSYSRSKPITNHLAHLSEGDPDDSSTAEDGRVFQ